MDAESHDNRLDITSDVGASPEASRRPTSKNSRSGAVRVYFKCCRVYVHLQLPKRVLQAELPNWRVHCPRCAQLVEIPITYEA